MFDKPKVEAAMKMLLEGVGEDVGRDGLLESPKRAANFFETVLCGYDIDPKQYVKLFDAESDDMVMVEGPLYSYCEHHFALFSGKIHIAYMPSGKVIGLSKLIRIARVFAKRFQVQERLTRQIADFLEQNLENNGVAVHIEAEHSCMTIRGVRTPGAKTNTIRMTGAFKTDPQLNQQFMQFIK